MKSAIRKEVIQPPEDGRDDFLMVDEVGPSLSVEISCFVIYIYLHHIYSSSHIYNIYIYGKQTTKLR